MILGWKRVIFSLSSGVQRFEVYLPLAGGESHLKPKGSGTFVRRTANCKSFFFQKFKAYFKIYMFGAIWVQRLDQREFSQQFQHHFFTFTYSYSLWSVLKMQGGAEINWPPPTKSGFYSTAFHLVMWICIDFKDWYPFFRHCMKMVLKK